MAPPAPPPVLPPPDDPPELDEPPPDAPPPDDPPADEPPPDEPPDELDDPLDPPPLEDELRDEPLGPELPAGGMPIEVGTPTEGIGEALGIEVDKQPERIKARRTPSPIILNVTLFMLMPPSLQSLALPNTLVQIPT